MWLFSEWFGYLFLLKNFNKIILIYFILFEEIPSEKVRVKMKLIMNK